ncbi:helix-turn-helix transcriptional regulator [Micromonospora sp. NPDC005305]|uniref:AraC family transcriptional regulator n=1 Tax=Micromonospora sp. NPDC005305 TaxID=3156875 RepID=UPI0033BD8B39
MSADGPISHRFDSRDPQRIRDYLAGAYGTRGLRISSGDHDYHLRHQRVQAGRFQADRLAQSTDLRVAVEEISSLVVCETATSRVSRSCDGEQGEYVPGDIFVAAPPGRRCRLRWQPGEVVLLQLDTHLFTQVARPDVRRRLAAIHFTALEPASPALAEHWRATAHYVRLAVLGNSEASREPLVIGAAARTLAAAALAVFPNTALTEPTAQDRRDAVVPTVRRAIAFMEEHAEQDISPADVAAAAAVSIRALQLAFRRHLDSTPMAQLRRIRLERAHHELRQADPRWETVSRIASRWGFPSHSRFAAHYRAVFGVPPSRTLHT